MFKVLYELENFAFIFEKMWKKGVSKTLHWMKFNWSQKTYYTTCSWYDSFGNKVCTLPRSRALKINITRRRRSMVPQFSGTAAFLDWRVRITQLGTYSRAFTLPWAIRHDHTMLIHDIANRVYSRQHNKHHDALKINKNRWEGAKITIVYLSMTARSR